MSQTTWAVWKVDLSGGPGFYGSTSHPTRQIGGFTREQAVQWAGLAMSSTDTPSDYQTKFYAVAPEVMP